MQGVNKGLVFLLSFLFFVAQANATHTIGADVSYRYLGNNRYEITVRQYSDCRSGDPTAQSQDVPLIFAVYNAQGSRVLVDSMFGQQHIKINASPLSGCFSDTHTYCVEYALLQKTIILPPSTSDYLWVYQRCCLSGTIANIDNPSAEGLTLTCNIPGNGINNTSPVFNTLPPVRQCINSYFNIDFSCTDVDGDSVSYRLVAPTKGGSSANAKPIAAPPPYQAFTYSNSFSPTRPFGNACTLVLDSATGIAFGSSSAPGMYMVAVACDEWRNGVLLNTTTRVISFPIVTCAKEANASIQKDSIVTQANLNGLSIARCGSDRTIHFDNTSTGATAYHWDFGVSGSADDTSSQQNPIYTYPGPGRYQLTLIVYGPTCNDTLRTDVLLSDDKVTPNFTTQGQVCIGDTLMLTDATVSSTPIAQHLWTVGANNYYGSSIQSPVIKGGTIHVGHTVITQAGCIANISRDIIVKQSAITASNDTVVALGASLFLQAYNGSNYHWYSVAPDMLYGPDFTLAAQRIYTDRPGKNLAFVVIGTDASGCKGIDTVLVTITPQGYAFVAPAFTPNNDGLNDILHVKLSGYNLIALKIYNRQGNEVFSTTNLNIGWNGKVGDKEAPVGTYYWMVKGQRDGGATEVFKGDVTLVR